MLAFLAFYNFGSHDPAFATFGDACHAQVMMMLGGFDFSSRQFFQVGLQCKD